MKNAGSIRHPDAPGFDVPIDDSAVDAGACRGLWAAVLMQQWELVFGTPALWRSADRPVARRWFGESDFFTVCALAGLDGRAVLERFHARLRATGQEGC